MTDQVFDATSPEVDQQTATSAEGTAPAVNTDPFAEALKGITKEDGSQKYTTVDAALSSIAPAQEHIARIEADNAKLRAEIEKATAVQEYLNKQPVQQEGVTAPTDPTVSAEQITNMVQQTVQGLKQQETVQANVESVNNALVNAFGDVDKAKAAIQAKAAELGTSIDSIKQLSGQSPKAVLAWFDTKPAQSAQPVRSDVNTDGFSQTNGINNQPYQTVMGAHSTKELVNAWKLSGERVKQS